MIFAVFLSLLMICTGAATVYAAPEARTGEAANQPAGGYTQGTTNVKLHNDTATTTVFRDVDMIHVNITTTVFPTLPDFGKVRLTDYKGAVFYETPGSAPFSLVASSGQYRTYLASIDTKMLAFSDDHYLLSAELRNQGGGSTRFSFSDVITIGSLGGEKKSIVLSGDDTFAQQKYKFSNRDTIFVKVYTPGKIDAGNSTVRILDYYENSFQLAMDELTAGISRSGNYSIFRLSLSDDVLIEYLLGTFPSGRWYTLQLDMQDTGGQPMASDWSVQFMLTPAPMITSVSASPAVIEMTSGATTEFEVDFTDTDAAGVTEFKVTIMVRDEADNVYTILDGATNGTGGLTVLDLGGGNYRAQFLWDPPGTMLKGDYDLAAVVEDGNNSAGIDEFGDNQDELELTTTATAPYVAGGDVWCSPAVVDRADTDTTTIYANFTDPQDTNRDDVDVTFAVRSPTNAVTTLVNAQGHGGAGQFGGTLRINVRNGWYTASYEWDPPAGQELGLYDLMVNVTTAGGTDIDPFENNTDELEIVDLGVAPAIKVGSVKASPSSLEKVGTYTTTISAEFTDADDHPIAGFEFTMRIRNDNNDVLTLLDGTIHGEPGELGGTLSVEKLLAGNYSITLDWDPVETTPVGTYDFWLEVRDLNGKSDVSNYGQNQDKLEIITNIKPPDVTSGTVTAQPSLVNMIGDGKTRIYAEFTDSKFSSASNFTVTFKVRDPSNNVIVLVDDKGTGGLGETGTETVKISWSGTLFTAEYRWDPPEDSEIGYYDLYFGVKNPDGGYAEDGFGANSDELQVTTSMNPPFVEESATWADPDTVEIIGTNTTKISAKFTDADLSHPSVFKVTFRVRNQTGGIITLAEGLMHNAPAPFGGIVSVVNGTANGSYTASVIWDPPNTTDAGLYDLYFAVQDDSLAVRIDDYNNNLNELNLTMGGGGEIPEPEPNIEMEVEIHHEEDNMFNFTVKYTNHNNLPPDANGVILIIDDKEHKMTEADANDTDYTDGKTYYYVEELHEEEIHYSVKVNDTSGEGLKLKTETYEPELEHEEHDTGWQVALTVLAIIIILIVLLLLSRARKPAPAAPAREYAAPAEDAAEEEPPMAEPIEGEEPAEPAEPAEPLEPAEDIMSDKKPGEPTITKIPPAEPVD